MDKRALIFAVAARRRRWKTQGYGHSAPKDEPFRHSHDREAWNRQDAYFCGSTNS